MNYRKIDESLNRLIRDTLERYKEIESPAIGLFPADNIYGRPPYFAFRFKDGTIDDYELVGKIITNFKGQLKWTISNKEGFKNYLIEPFELKEYRDRNGNLKIEKLIEEMGPRFYEISDNAVDDIEPLCSWIESRLL